MRFRIVDRLTDRGHESRALAIQPRTLEVLEPFGVSERLVALGNRAVRVVVHARGRAVPLRLFDAGVRDTAYPFLLFLSQSLTEQVLVDHLGERGVRVEHGTELVGLHDDGEAVVCSLRSNDDGPPEVVRARYVVGADGAHSSVRRFAGIGFPGRDYPQTFVLADLEVDGLEPGAAHVFLADAGVLFFFPLLTPATWRVLAMEPPGRAPPRGATVRLSDVQAAGERYGARVRVHDPVWMTRFRLHSRAAAAFRAGGVFLAGDAAHIHSPAGAQGMNTGIQDAVNLGWKLGLVASGRSPAALLDSYEAERAPVARRVLAMADRAFRVATSTAWPVRPLRTRLVPVIAPAVLRLPFARAAGFRVVAQLAIRYRAGPLTARGTTCPWRAPGPGDRLPDAPLAGTTLHRALSAPGFHVLLCGPSGVWSEPDVDALRARPLVHVHRITRWPTQGALVDAAGRLPRVLRPTRAGATAVLLVRPDGHIAFRGRGPELAALIRYLDTWLPADRSP
jgi:2-polyprenyl-6-methoxyphenol hydroxylase-like FAD-dependent oxidoreductase